MGRNSSYAHNLPVQVVDKILQLLRDTTLSCRTIANRFGVSASVVTNINRKHNVRPFGHRPKFSYE